LGAHRSGPLEINQGTIVGKYHARHMAEDDGAHLDVPDWERAHEEVDLVVAGPEEVPSQAKGVGRSANQRLALKDDQCEVVSERVRKRNREATCVAA